MHVPYAAGLMMVNPGSYPPPKENLSWWYSEDYSTLDSFAERSDQMLSSFVNFLAVKAKKSHRIYFHNFSRFDGLLLIRHLSTNHSNWKLIPLMRNGILYELVVVLGKNKRMRFRDSASAKQSSIKYMPRTR